LSIHLVRRRNIPHRDRSFSLSIRELARQLDVSIGTVSRALNGRSDVSPATRERVLEAAQRLGYAPNQSGRSLRQGTTGMVAMMIPTSRKMPLADPIFLSVLDGMRAFLAERELDLMVLLCGPEETAFAYLRRVVGRRLADGIIIADTQRHDPRIDYLLEKRIPFAAFGRSRSGGAHPWIDLDFEGAAAAGVARLAGLGHQRIALATTANESNYGYVFAEGYRAAMLAAELPFRPEMICRVPNNEDGGYQLGERLLAMAPRPTGVLLVHDTMAIGLYRRLHEAGLKPGEDLAVIGFLNQPSVHFLSPKLTCFRTGLGALGARLGEALVATMPLGDGTGAAIQEVWPLQLVPGESDRGRPGIAAAGRRARA